jgi:hypothetical protein
MPSMSSRVDERPEVEAWECDNHRSAVAAASLQVAVILPFSLLSVVAKLPASARGCWMPSAAAPAAAVSECSRQSALKGSAISASAAAAAASTAAAVLISCLRWPPAGHVTPRSWSGPHLCRGRALLWKLA